jgi:YihY family inner membrane protein
VGAGADPAPSAGAEESVRGARRLVAAVAIAVPAFFRHRGTQLAAAISYRVLFSLVPFLALALSLLDLVLSAESEARIDEWLAGLAPGGNDLEESIARTLASTGAAASVAGVVALAGLLWTASGMAASIRMALAVVWEEERGRPYVRAKLVDLGLVFVGVALVLAAFVANLSMQLLTTYGAELAGKLGLERVDARLLGSLGQTIVALAVTIVALLVLYRLAPRGPSLRQLLPGAIVGGVAVHLAIVAFSAYVGVMAGFEEVYGALGGVFGFLFLVYLVASAIVVGAEVVAAWPEAARPRPASGTSQPLAERVRAAVRGLVSPARGK